MLLGIGVCGDVALLAYCKYAGFLMTNLNQLTDRFPRRYVPRHGGHTARDGLFSVRAPVLNANVATLWLHREHPAPAEPCKTWPDAFWNFAKASQHDGGSRAILPKHSFDDPEAQCHRAFFRGGYPILIRQSRQEITCLAQLHHVSVVKILQSTTRSHYGVSTKLYFSI